MIYTRIRRYMVFLFLLALSGCATTEKYKKILSSYIGSSEEALLLSMGVPHNIYALSDDKKVLTYSERRSMVLPGIDASSTTSTTYNYSTANSYTRYNKGTPPQIIDLSCDTSFILKNGIVINFSIRGNNCTSY